MDKKSQLVEENPVLTVFDNGTWSIGSGKLIAKPHRATIMNKIYVKHATPDEIEHLKRSPHDAQLLQKLKERAKIK